MTPEQQLKDKIAEIVGASMIEYAPLNRPIRPYFEIVDEAVAKIISLIPSHKKETHY